MLKKFTNLFSDGESSKQDKHIEKLNVLIWLLVSFIGIYSIVFLYQMEMKTESIQHSQEFLRTVVTLPATIQFSGHTNLANIAIVSTNITKEPSQVKISEKSFTVEKEYARGDVVMIRYFNTYGVVEDKATFSKDYYRVLYRDNNHRLNFIDVPIDFLLKPAADALNPFIFTP